jgi:hypothetical protein
MVAIVSDEEIARWKEAHGEVAGQLWKGYTTKQTLTGKGSKH